MQINQGEKNKEQNQEEDDLDEFIRQRIAIHAMPKRFIKNSVKSGNSKSIGLIIFFVGFLLLAGVGFFVYYFLFNDLSVLKFNKNEVVVVEEKRDIKNSENVDQVKDLEKNQEEKKSLSQAKDAPLVSTSSDNNSQETIIDNDSIALEQIATSGEDLLNNDSLLASSSEPKEIKIIEAKSEDSQTVFKRSADGDMDGLSDFEEILLGSNLAVVDSDGDGYSDLDELKGQYNPTGLGKIEDSGNFIRYKNLTYKYSLLYPKSWMLKNVDGDDLVMFVLDQGQFIQIITQQNTNGEFIDDWVRRTVSMDEIGANQIYSRGHWRGIKTNDGLTIYLNKAGTDIIFTVSYTLGASNVLNYENIFNLIIDSLEIS